MPQNAETIRAFLEALPQDKVDFGTKGMRWGVRHKRGPNGRVNGNHESSAHKSISEMSDDELRTVINRMNLEKQFRELTKTPKSPGRAYVEKALKDAGNKQVQVLLAKAGTKVLEAALTATTSKQTAGLAAGTALAKGLAKAATH
jgi:rRNA maturation endonuclease Nob1